MSVSASVEEEEDCWKGAGRVGLVGLVVVMVAIVWVLGAMHVVRESVEMGLCWWFS